MTTYVAFTLPRTGRLPSGLAVAEVESRDIQNLDIPEKASSFYFFDAPDAPEARRDPLGHESNPSPVYLVAKDIWPKERLKEHFAKSKSFRRKAQDKTPAGKLTKGEIFRAVWEVKAESACHHAVGRNGEIMQIRKGMVVIDENKRVLVPGGTPRKKKAPQCAEKKPPAVRRPARNYRL